MRFQSTNNTKFSNERGAYLVIATVAIVMLLFLAGLAVDSARLYLTKNELQSAVDAAAIGAGNLIVTQPGRVLTGSGPNSSTVESMARDLLQANLIRMGFSSTSAALSSSTANICFGRPSELKDGCPINSTSLRAGIRVSANIVQPTLIIGLLPGVAKSNLVNAISVVSNLRLRAVLVLDESSSMAKLACAASSGCTVNRINALKYAVSRFIDTLLPIDQVGIVKYSLNYGGNWWNEDVQNPSSEQEYINNYTNDAVNLTNGYLQVGSGSNSQKPLLKSLVQAMEPFSNTDIGAGIQAGRLMLDIANHPIEEDEIPVLILVTDGAPMIDNDTFNYTMLTRDTTDSAAPRRIRDICAASVHANDPAQYLTVDEGGVIDSDPSDTTTPADIQKKREKRRRLNVIDSILEADAVRQDGIMLYSIGMGMQNTDLSSPFQSKEDSQHPFLLWRLANDQSKMRLPPAPFSSVRVSNYDQLYPTDFPCVSAGRTISSQPIGQYYDASTGNDLYQAFEDIAGKLRNKIVK